MAQNSVSATNSVQACENIIDPKPFRERSLFVPSCIGKTGFKCVYLCKIGLPVNKTKGEGEGQHCCSFTAILPLSLNSWMNRTIAGSNITRRFCYIQNTYILFSFTCQLLVHTTYFSPL